MMWRGGLRFPLGSETRNLVGGDFLVDAGAAQLKAVIAYRTQRPAAAV